MTKAGHSDRRFYKGRSITKLAWKCLLNDTARQRLPREPERIDRIARVRKARHAKSSQVA